MNFRQSLRELYTKFKQLESKIYDHSIIGSGSFAELSKEYSDMLPLIALIEIHDELEREISDLKEVMNNKSVDRDVKNMAEEEYYYCSKKLASVIEKIKIALLPIDADNKRNAIIEIRAGTGGEEAALFASDLYRMYQKYSERREWKFEPINISSTGLGGFKEASAVISGNNVFERLKFEGGVHRVQRVPETESSGRLHTSAATVAILPEVEDIDLKIDEKDLRIDVYRSSGPGGQSVNTTDSAIRITHIPTGTVVIQQDEKSQHKNKAKALKVLRARLYEAEKRKNEKERSVMRNSQIGSGDRSERIRTYNFPQSRVSDHRINLTLYRIDAIVREGDLDEIIESLLSNDEIERLSMSSWND